jgi:hypothetical protein|tara:strand:+ start:329 stop:607 length:279 start_codon:yes stop_codon:yes gene_type:complete
MTRYHATSNGNVAFTAAEETERDAEEAAWAAGADDRAAAEARQERNDLLAATDWTANSDVTMTTEMTAYRTLLRNLPAQADFPTTITWPTEP